MIVDGFGPNLMFSTLLSFTGGISDRTFRGGWFTLGGTSGEEGVGDNKDTRMILLPFCFSSCFCRFFFFPFLAFLEWTDDLALRFLHVYAAHGIDETNMEFMLRNYPYFVC